MQTCWWPLSDHWSMHLISPHLPGFVWYGGLKAHRSYLRYEDKPIVEGSHSWSVDDPMGYWSMVLHFLAVTIIILMLMLTTKRHHLMICDPYPHHSNAAKLASFWFCSVIVTCSSPLWHCTIFRLMWCHRWYELMMPLYVLKYTSL